MKQALKQALKQATSNASDQLQTATLGTAALHLDRPRKEIAALAKFKSELPSITRARCSPPVPRHQHTSAGGKEGARKSPIAYHIEKNMETGALLGDSQEHCEIIEAEETRSKEQGPLRRRAELREGEAASLSSPAASKER